MAGWFKVSVSGKENVILMNLKRSCVLMARRYFTEKKAIEYGITGWVRNTATNKVEGEAQGEAAALEKFVKAIDDGPKHAHVVRLDKEYRAVVENEAGFKIRRD